MKHNVKRVVSVTEEQKEVLDKLTTTTSKVRYLASEGYSTESNMYSGIANYLGISTQHVRNILTREVKRK